ncbi:hypothetical protein Y032_0119g804 [Ancylostoma ceylanicum]|uniref:Uncharacterized protein n=1 Tax=Ancylostoma ceylanicum TaxID=53326 RepID=A0A016TA38_9BILA|nr:hypothetical protein Y032_0119g804 [Ancylostoma ceylanicum]
MKVILSTPLAKRVRNALHANRLEDCALHKTYQRVPNFSNFSNKSLHRLFNVSQNKIPKNLRSHMFIAALIAGL